MEEYSRKGEPLRTFSIDLSQDQAKTQAERLAILRHPTRQRIIRLLEKYNDKRLCVFEMADVVLLNDNFEQLAEEINLCPEIVTRVVKFLRWLTPPVQRNAFLEVLGAANLLSKT